MERTEETSRTHSTYRDTTKIHRKHAIKHKEKKKREGCLFRVPRFAGHSLCPVRQRASFTREGMS
ncbi:hypothetical protein HID58_056427 [Brassica napus]|uniref:Uncharacterized protein n=1 Tax=Brassica napus TaxID=3708 RepID=A0ABQ8ANL2_BRANA|nr:hypothetical protein HID58_056427 [Brassica napus]